jgi:hypothetical protein
MSGSRSRDRDTAGRPRNARPRDGLGRPLERSADEGVPRVPDDLAIEPPDAVRLADRMLRDGQPFHAHEVLEAVWKTGSGSERDLWQGLAQIAVGITHARRGNARGAVALLRRGTNRVAGYVGPSYGMELTRITASAEAIAAQIERDGITDTDYTLRLMT